MKKMFQLILIICFVFVLCSCTEEKEIDEEPHMESTEEVGTKKEFLNSISSFIDDIGSSYSLVLYSLDFDRAYGQSYALYDIEDVNEFNYPNYNAVATFSVYFEKNNDEARVVDLLYTFPISNNESEDNLKAEYKLYTYIMKGILSKSSEEKINEITDFFSMKEYNDLLKIYNEEITYDYKIVDMGETQEDYMSTLFLSDNKRITFEYHDSDFEEEKMDDAAS